MKKTKNNMWYELLWFNKPISFWCSFHGLIKFYKFILSSRNQIKFDNKYGITRYYLEEEKNGDKSLSNPYIWNYKKIHKYSKNDWTNDINLNQPKKFLEDNFDKIKIIFYSINDQIEMHPETSTSLDKGYWKRIPIYDIGGWTGKNKELEKLLTNNFDICTSHGLVFFSQTDPCTEIKGHFGSTNLRLRIHLGLNIPDNTGLTVKGETLNWEEGKVLIFDDSYFHSSYNRSKKKRIILIIDVYNPYLTNNEKRILNYPVMRNLGKM